MFGRSKIARIWNKLLVHEYRHSYLASHTRSWLAYQIRALRQQRGWSQSELADKAGKPQSVISRIEDPSYGKLSVQTLLDVASTFDVALTIKFVPFSEFLRQSQDVSPAAMGAASFAEDALRPNIARQATLPIARGVILDQTAQSSRTRAWEGSETTRNTSRHVH